MMWERIKKIAYAIRHTQAVRETAYVYAGSFANGTALFLVSTLLAHTLDQKQFGIFSIAILVLNTAAEISDFGLNAVLLRFVPHYHALGDESKLKQLLKTVWQWRVRIAVVATACGVFGAELIATHILGQPETAAVVRISSLGIGGVILLGFVSLYIQSSRQFIYAATLSTLKGWGRLALVGLLVLCGVHHVPTIAIAYVIVPWILLVASMHRLPKGFLSIETNQEFKKELGEQLKHFSFWFTIWSFSSIIASRIDQAMISHYLGLEAVALYSIAYQPMIAYTMAQNAVGAVTTPRINGLKTREDVKLFIVRLWKWIIPAGVIVALLVYPSRLLIPLIFGSRYIDAMQLYVVLSYSMILSFIAAPLSVVVTWFNKAHLVAYGGFIQLVVNMGLNFVLIPRYGAMGAVTTFALGICASAIYNAVCASILIRKKEVSL